MAWSWRYENGDGEQVEGPGDTFASQADAESWVGQEWKKLVADGVSTVVLVDEERVEYRMSLHPAGT
jgi:hypothetical protein